MLGSVTLDPAGVSQAGPPLPQCCGSSFPPVQKCVPFPHSTPLASTSFRVTSGSCWGCHVSAWIWAVFLCSEVFLSLTLWAGRQDSGFPACLAVLSSLAGLQRVTKLLCFLLCGEGGRAFPQGWQVSGIPGGHRRSPWHHSTKFLPLGL